MSDSHSIAEPTAELARFATTLTLDEIPAEVTHRVKLLLLDALGAALVGDTSQESGQVMQAADRLFGAGDSTVIGAGKRSPSGATLINGYLITARSFCDVHQPTLCHITPVAMPPVLTAAEAGHSTGAAVVRSLAVALESTVRVGMGLDYPVFRGRGWHTPGVAGPIGGALGVCSLWGLDRGRTEQAIGIAGSQAAGTFASFGTPTIKLHQARAAWAGLFSAEAVRAGFVGPTGLLTATDGGLLGTYSDGGRPDLITASLGQRWELTSVTTRLWPAAAALQAVISMILIDEPRPPDADEIQSVVISLPPASHEMHAAMGWETPFQAVLSARYVTAMVLEERRCWLDQFAPDRLSETGPADLDHITTKLDDALPEGGARLTIVSRSGHETSLSRQFPKGHPSDPASWDETAHKFEMAAQGVLEPRRVSEVVEMVGSLEHLPDVANLLELVGRKGL